ncbi:MAG TPA: FecR domain-containing protein, partial [Bacteroidales bacterium]|nr:FecR domain-containing protein [Bacteroidales bacterium]
LIYLIIKRLTNTIESEENAILKKWLESSVDNQRIYNEVSDIWLASYRNSEKEYDSFAALDKVKLRLEELKVEPNNKKKHPILFPLLRIAAVMLILIAVGMLSYRAGSQKEIPSPTDFTEIQAPLGSRTRVNLPDGTKVWLNSGSLLRFANSFNKTERSVTITGEGYFDVSHNKKLPFVVNTKEIRIKVIGTAFNIKAYPDDGLVETTLERGSLAIETVMANGKTVPKTVLEPNQRATFVKNEGKIHLSDVDKEVTKKINNEIKTPIKEQLLISKKIDTKIFTAWKDNKLVFRNEPFESLVIKLERWYGVNIEIKDEEINNYHFNGTFEKETIQDVLNIIHFALPIQYEVAHDQVYISLDKKAGKHKL